MTKSINTNKKTKWYKIKRSTGLIEWVCEHDVGHPDYQSAKEIAKKLNHPIDVWLIHGCDGCCSKKDFPGKKDG